MRGRKRVRREIEVYERERYCDMRGSERGRGEIEV